VKRRRALVATNPIEEWPGWNSCADD